jgi:hypothetical protein
MGLRLVGESKDRPQNDFEDKKKVAYPLLRMRTARMSSGEEVEDVVSARIHFLSDWGEDLVWGRFHKVPTRTRDGSEYGKETACSHSETCPYCKSDDRDIRRAYLRCFFYVYVYRLYHKQQDFDEWEEANRLISEPLDEINILQVNLSLLNGLQKEFDFQFKSKGTLKSIDYYWQRYGCGLKTEYHLIPCDESELPLEKFSEMEKNLPSLESLVVKVKKPRKKKEVE